MSHEQHWIVKAGIVSGYIIIAIVCAVTTIAIYHNGFHWTYIGGLAMIAAIIMAWVWELRTP